MEQKQGPDLNEVRSCTNTHSQVQKPKACQALAVLFSGAELAMTYDVCDMSDKLY